MVARRAGTTKAVTRSWPQTELPLPAIRCVLVGDVPPSQGKREPPLCAATAARWWPPRQRQIWLFCVPAFPGCASTVIGRRQVSATLWRSSGQAGVGSGIVNTFHELGGAITVAVVSSIAAPSLAATSLSSAGFTRAFTFSAVAALAAVALAALIVPAGEAPAGAMPHAH